MYVYSRLFPREEVVSIWPIAKDGGAHGIASTRIIRLRLPCRSRRGQLPGDAVTYTIHARVLKGGSDGGIPRSNVKVRRAHQTPVFAKNTCLQPYGEAGRRMGTESNCTL